MASRLEGIDKPMADAVRRLTVCRAVLWAPLLIAVCGVAGCGPRTPPTIKVSGRVVLDGQPLANAAVVFQPQAGGRAAYGVTNGDGLFVMTTFQHRDGAIPGLHAVTVVCSEAVSPETTVWKSPEIYSFFDQSGLAADVSPQSTSFTFELSSKAPAPRR